ncbi:glucose-6-phosphatase 2-like [Patiria miniata]|uniref:Glucose-6-phosphatase n=1 Tax=Patiria miniata TaxID=46514 RepID=A0A913ZCH9_PATMI|nr:glucose-6-phosphatase 2-like [Patiria miniata]
MDRLQAIEITHLQRLQHVFGDYSEAMLFLSHLGDPRSAFLMCVPLVYCISRGAGLKVLWAAVMSEWLNLLLKWILNGHRPYWWVHESKLYEDDNRPIIKQYRLTCETGPGVPSGHAMVATAVWFIMMSSLATHLATMSKSTNPRSRLMRFICILPWLFLAGLASVICVSRVFIATHFTHQVLLGVLVGVLVGLFISNLQVHAFSTSTHVGFAIFVVLATFLQYGIMAALNFDPSWSMTLALRWCERREWVHLDTTPLYCIARDFGSLTLLAASERFVATKEIAGVGRQIAAVATSLICAQLIELVRFPMDNVSVFYAMGAVKYGAVVVSTVAIKRLCCYGKKNKTL